ncbi:MAG: NADH-quinone oxidoreductase subunit M [Acidobacteria bacterium]|nr:NADH-quinone oxidoreductase subunit M [Acidobacteriota bacterium]
MEFGILSLITFLPLAGAIVILFLPKRDGLIKTTAMIFATASFISSLVMFLAFKSQLAGMQFVENFDWFEIGEFKVNYHLGVDGISILLVMLTTFLTPLVLLSSWRSIKDRMKEYMMFMLFLETGMLGVFLSLDMVLFYIFWEIMLIPMYFIIGIWGGPRKIYAAVKFFIYTMVGSVLMLVSIIYLYIQYQTLNIVQLANIINLPLDVEKWLFLAFFLAFAIKVPIFPLHTWLPDAHVEAPTPGSVILAGVLLKMGTYGLLRFCIGFFPESAYYFKTPIAILAVIGITYGALVSLVQRDMKKLVAYSSVSHLGFVVLGLFAVNTIGIQGGIIQMINHGLSTGGLFLIVGMIYERRHTRQISEFGGISKSMPIFAVFFMVIALSSLGLPGLNGFVGEFNILLGSFTSVFYDNPIFTIIAGTGVILAAAYILWWFKRVMFGPLDNEKNKKLKDMSLLEIAYTVPLVLFIVWIGIYPTTFMSKSEATVNAMVKRIYKKLDLKDPAKEDRIEFKMPKTKVISLSDNKLEDKHLETEETE